jgi:short-chain fatty acids transporter
MSFALVNWGLGLIVGALLAREMAVASKRRGLRVHYPLLGAAGYTGLLVWHGGLSGSAPLKITQTKDLAEILGRTDITPITLADTLFSPMNLAVCGALLVVVPLILMTMAPADDEIVEIADDPAPSPAAELASDEPLTPAQRLERSPILVWLVAAVSGFYLVRYLGKIGVASIDLNGINLVFLTLGLVLHGSARAYGEAITNGVRGCAGIILQFPFYAGIMGVMALSGLVGVLAQGVIDVANEATFAPLTMISAGLVNLFVPSGGGQWAIQGPLVVQSAEALGVPLGKAVMAFAYGDAWTNMLQPFWALPLLGITGLKARQIVGYTAALMLLVFPVYLLAFALF